MPKVAFYEHLQLKPQKKKLFVSQIDKLTLANSIKPSTMNIRDGEKYHEVLVLLVHLKHKELDESLLVTIARQNGHPLVFVCRYLNESQIYVYRQRLYGTGWLPTDATTLNTSAEDLDQLWDSICSQIALGTEDACDILDLDTRLSLNQRISALEAESRRLMERSRKEKQPATKNRLHEDARAKMRELERLKAGA
jgi:hypothetical protein